MLGRFRSAIYSAIGPIEDETNGDIAGVGAHGARHGSPLNKPSRQKYSYQRPAFLKLETDDEIQVTADHSVRPIIVPRDVSALPWYSGYAETINAGKSRHNEDQAMCRQGSIPVVVGANIHQLQYTIFSIFDGHAGAATAVTASNDLWQAVHARLESVGPQLLAAHNAAISGTGDGISEPMWFPARSISSESLVIGALEAAFWETDSQIGEEKKVYAMPGGCTVLLSLFILGKLYVANAGDSRGVLCRSGRSFPLSHDFTPVTERQRLQQLGRLAPHLLGQEYTHLEYARRPTRRDLGARMLYRDAYMTGWAYKVIQESDMKFPLVYGEGKRSRLLATIGVTRGFGDHDLRAQSQNGTVMIKPFLTPQPEVRVVDLQVEDIHCEDVLVLGTDGLWDVVSNDEVASIVQRGLQQWDNESRAGKYRYISLAQDLVMAARGKLKERNWRRNSGGPATIDDISVFVIPLLPYKLESESSLLSSVVPEESSLISAAVPSGESAVNGDTEDGREAMEVETELEADTENENESNNLTNCDTENTSETTVREFNEPEVHSSNDVTRLETNVEIGSSINQ